MDNVEHFAKRLEHYKQINPPPEYDPTDGHNRNRHTYCHIMYCLDKSQAFTRHKPGWHKFEVRKWHITEYYRVIELSCVNWTIASGVCTVAIKDDTIHLWKLLEDEPALQVLYG